MQTAEVADKNGNSSLNHKNLIAIATASAKQIFRLAGKKSKLPCDIVSVMVLSSPFLFVRLLFPPTPTPTLKGAVRGNQGNSLIGRGSFPKRIWSVLGFVLPNETALRITKGFF